jgi:hypothetical protein
MLSISEEQLSLYISLFRGRTDVYARRWEKHGKCGYTPAYSFIWDEYLRHKAKGGDFHSFENKEKIPLSRDIIKKHLIGAYFIGVYPLLEDNSSYFVAIHFDGKDWKKDSKKFISECRQLKIPAYTERSLSGKGAHIWTFFKDKYPAAKSRKIFLEIVRKALDLSDFGKEVSFDRIFPNQDYHSGKGFGIELIAKKCQPALIIVHRKQIFDQWVERIQDFLGMVKKDIGQISAGKKKISKYITVAMIQSLAKYQGLKDLSESFGTIIIDECHHIPAKSFRKTIVNFNPYNIFGLTATPKRKYNDEKLIFLYIGDIICNTNDIVQDFQKIFEEGLQLNIKDTNLYFPYDNKTDDFQILSKVIIFDSERNRLIAEDIKKELKPSRKILVLTERKEHVEVLSIYLKSTCEVITITADDSKSLRKIKMKQIEEGNFQVLITTGQLLGEGLDTPNLSSIFLVYPFSFEGKLIQYIGRILRASGRKSIYDYRDKNNEFLLKLYKKRERYYRREKLI